jgi:stress-induced morphogen
MIDDETLATLIRVRLPDARISVRDLTGTRDHLDVTVRSQTFAGMPLLDRHRAVYAALREALDDGRIHALQLTTLAEEETP